MGKPGHPEEARTMLRRIEGDVHEVFTGLAIGAWDGGAQIKSVVDVAEVTMLPMTEEEIAWYVGTGEPLDKAGGICPSRSWRAVRGQGGREPVHGDRSADSPARPSFVAASGVSAL